MIVSIDYVLFHAFPGDGTEIEEQGMVSTVEEAIRLGADAIKVLMIFGRDDPALQARNFDVVGRVCQTCHAWGMPAIVEPTTWGHRFTSKAAKNAKVLRDMARIAFEFGADVVKIDTPEDPNDFSIVAGSCPVPILVLGGAKKSSPGDLMRHVDSVVNEGALGVTFGRNVWQNPDPAGIIRALRLVVHERDLEAGIAELNLGEERDSND
jgi:class I fructose-bisphosphate aldolase